MNDIAIMQGRLLPPLMGRLQAFPAHEWRKEFKKSRQAGISCIEWIYEKQNENLNPLSNDQGIIELLQIIKSSFVEVRSVCADYYMDEVLINSDGTFNAKIVDHLSWLIQQASKLSIIYLIIPFVDKSRLKTRAQCKSLISLMQEIGPKVAKKGLEIHLETDLDPKEFSSMLQTIGHPSIKANFDIGNSASLGYDPKEEIEALAPFLGSVHVKDRVFGGKTVPLGEGDADFATCFDLIQRQGFSRHFVLQTARGIDGREINLAIENRKFIERHLSSILL